MSITEPSIEIDHIDSEFDDSESELGTQSKANPLDADFSHPLVEDAYDSLMMSVDYLNKEEQANIVDACHFGDQAHIHDKRKSGEPYITHPIAVAEILAGFRLDSDTIIAAILHDTVEDTDVTLEQLELRYNQDVAQLVDGVTKLKSSSHNKQENKAATFYKILIATLEDPRVLIIKLSDRLHNMSTLGAVRREKQRSTANETLAFYIPFARVMGMNDIADYIEILCYRNLDPEMYTKLSDKLLQHGLGRKFRKDEIQHSVQKLLRGIELNGHVKALDHQVAMYRQFFRNRGSLDSLLRQYALEIVLDSVKDCQRLSEYLIEKYDIEPNEISDNISNPLPGGNQSLTLNYQYQNETIIITILTKTMKKTARLGVIGAANAPDVSQSVIQASLRNMKALIGDVASHHNDGNHQDTAHGEHTDIASAVATIDELMDYLHERKILCYSPRSQAYELPRGATALDFAYAVGPKVGNVAIAAKIDGQVADLASVVDNGQTIEIITNSSSTPKAEWLGFVGTSKARELIRKWLKDLPNEDKQRHGKQALARALRTYDKKLDDLTPSNWRDLLIWRKLESREELYEQITLANLLPQLVVARLFSEEISEHLDADSQNRPQNLLATLPGVEITFPRCCNPIYGDPIIGYNSTNHGLVVHRHKCYSLKEVRDEFPNRIYHLKWREDEAFEYHQAGEHAHFQAYLEIDLILDGDQLSNTLSRLRQLNIGIEKRAVRKNSTILHVYVRSRKHLQEGIDELRNLLGFASIKRLYQLT